jgi:hypothetical protein
MDSTGENHSNTSKKQDGRKNNMPPESGMFKPGDPRINRNGRPRKADKLCAALFDKWESAVLDKDGSPQLVHGKPVTHGEFVMQKMFADTRLYPELLNRMFGKVRDEVEVTARNIEIRRINPDEIEEPETPLEEVTESCAD